MIAVIFCLVVMTRNLWAFAHAGCVGDLCVLFLTNSLSPPPQVMVIIKRDDYISFINSTGVIKMPITPANDISTQPTGNGGAPIPPNTPPSNQSANISTIKRDSSQQQLQQLQQYTQAQNQSLLAKAQLVCRPNSHPFPVSCFEVGWDLVD
jgi:hypothetical protein